MDNKTAAPNVSPDHDDRVKDFLTRHGGRAAEADRGGSDESGLDGWSETVAADGFRLRCDWSRTGGRDEMKFSELPPLH